MGGEGGGRGMTGVVVEAHLREEKKIIQFSDDVNNQGKIEVSGHLPSTQEEENVHKVWCDRFVLPKLDGYCADRWNTAAAAAASLVVCWRLHEKVLHLS